MSLRPFVLMAACLPLAGCGTLFATKCAKPGDFAAAVDNPPLNVPEGTDAPDTRGALKIPPLAATEAERPKDQPCIDTPPKFTPAPTKPAAPKPPAN
ncbi:MAG: hypothetical protein ACKO7G_13035 [Gammaproteobacteria bacterium]